MSEEATRDTDPLDHFDRLCRCTCHSPVRGLVGSHAAACCCGHGYKFYADCPICTPANSRGEIWMDSREFGPTDSEFGPLSLDYHGTGHVYNQQPARVYHYDGSDPDYYYVGADDLIDFDNGLRGVDQGGRVRGGRLGRLLRAHLPGLFGHRRGQLVGKRWDQ